MEITYAERGRRNAVGYYGSGGAFKGREDCNLADKVGEVETNGLTTTTTH